MMLLMLWRDFGMAATGLLSTDTFEGNGVEVGVDKDDDEYGW